MHVKRSAKRFLLNAENYTDFAERNPHKKPASNNPRSSDKICSAFAPLNRDYSGIRQSCNTISELTPNNSHSKDKIENANNPLRLFALNHSTDQLDKEFNNFQRFSTSFHNVLMMSQSNAEKFLQIKPSTPFKVRFTDEAGPSTAPSVPATPSTPNTDTTTVTSPSADDLYTDAFNFALSKIFSSTLMASLTSKDAILKEIWDCILTDNEDSCRQVSIYIHSFWKEAVYIFSTWRTAVYVSTIGSQSPTLYRTPPWKRFMPHISGVGGWRIWRYMHGGCTCIGTSLQKRPNATLASKSVKI